MPDAAPLHVVGLGPGTPSLLTPAASMALMSSQCLVGYSLYLDLLPPEIKAGKAIHTTPMRQETQRCVQAIDLARTGHRTAMVCSGDAGIYAMASLVLELLESRDLRNFPLEIIPGVPAFCAAAAALGAPVGHDFASVSLSDLLTPREVIFNRLRAVLAADFVVILYNPRSRGRPDHLAHAMEMALTYRSPSCPVGLVRNAGRVGEMVRIGTLADFDASAVDMLSLLIIGNGQSRHWDKYIITPRGYGIPQVPRAD